jgi:hypothetical protein
MFLYMKHATAALLSWIPIAGNPVPDAMAGMGALRTKKETPNSFKMARQLKGKGRRKRRRTTKELTAF